MDSIPTRLRDVNIAISEVRWRLIHLIRISAIGELINPDGGDVDADWSWPDEV
jgi:hypothetical protein